MRKTVAKALNRKLASKQAPTQAKWLKRLDSVYKASKTRKRGSFA